MVAILTNHYNHGSGPHKNTATMITLRPRSVTEIQPRRRRLRKSLNWWLRYISIYTHTYTERLVYWHVQIHMI